jgi:hypothetical protein
MPGHLLFSYNTWGEGTGHLQEKMAHRLSIDKKPFTIVNLSMQKGKHGTSKEGRRVLS